MPMKRILPSLIIMVMATSASAQTPPLSQAANSLAGDWGAFVAIANHVNEGIGAALADRQRLQTELTDAQAKIADLTKQLADAKGSK